MLAAQAQVGPYRIESLIGRGGMGEVYRARDTRLGRDVAIKTLPAEAAHDSEFRARAEREARVVAALNHPHICAIHDVGREGLIEYIVFEYVKGETLAAMLRRGPMPLNRALEYAVQIADALTAAHEAGVIHRDLKPGNIMVDPAAGVKLLDFGLAKFSERNIVLARDTTLTAMPDIQTTEGTVIGTLNYMSPEQAEGKPVDARTDIFSFGAVLYEMITGRKAFDGESSLSVLSAILRDQPRQIRDIATGIPAGLERVVEHSLRKDPRRRFQHIADLKFSLEALKDEHHPASAVQSGSQRPRPRGVILVALLALAIASAALLARYFSTRNVAPGPITRSTIALAGEDVLDTQGASIALSKDGRLLAFVGNNGTSSRLFVRPMDASDPQPLPGTEGATGPFFSPDGQWLGFFAKGKLQKIRVDGQGPVVLCDAVLGRGGTWGPDDTIVFNPSSGFGAGLMRISAAGGVAQPISRPDPMKYENSHRWPEFLPDGKHLLYFAADAGNFDVWTMELARLSPVRVTFDRTAEYYGIWESDGQRVTYSSNRHGPQNLFSSRTDGTEVEKRLTTAPNFQFTTEWTRDRTMLAFTQFGFDTGSNIWLFKKGAPSAVPFLQTSFNEGHAAFSPNGRWLAYSSDESGTFEVYVKPVEGGSKSKISIAGGIEPVWAASGGEIFFRHGNEMMAAPTQTEPSFTAGQPRVVFRGSYNASHASRNYDVTADGRRFVMMKNVDDQSPAKALHLITNALNELGRNRDSKRP